VFFLLYGALIKLLTVEEFLRLPHKRWQAQEF
jgi:hypothetical protein